MRMVPAKGILTRTQNSGSWFGYDYGMNLYRGCCHGCVYCDSRSECYQIERFDQVALKENAIGLLSQELRSKRKAGIVGTGAMSDPYNPFEEKERVTRRALGLLRQYGFGVGIATKSSLITRDIDVLQGIREYAPAFVKITITTADDALSRLLEPGVCASSERFSAVERLGSAGIYTGLLLMPVLPFLEDDEENVRKIVRLASEAGARFIYPFFGVTLRANQREYFYEQLDELFPGVKAQYQKAFGEKYACYSPETQRLRRVFQRECQKAGLVYRMADIIEGYRKGYSVEQLSLF